MKFEDLPSELWFLILSYLSPIDVFYAFDHIRNRRLHSIITSIYRLDSNDPHLSLSFFDLPLKFYRFAQSNIVNRYSHQISLLKLSNRRTPGQIEDFLRRYSFETDFPQLKSIELIEPTANQLTTIIQDLNDIELCRIYSREMDQFDSETIQQLIYRKASLKLCSLSQFRSEFLSIGFVSSLQELNLQSCDYQTMISIINQFSLLTKLSIENLAMIKRFSLSDLNIVNKQSALKDLKLSTFNIPFDYLEIIFPLLTDLQHFSLTILGNEGFDYVNSDRWQMSVKNHWPLLTRFSLYSELWHLTSSDLADLHRQLLLFEKDAFWSKRQITFSTDFYHDENSVHLIFYTRPYPKIDFSNQWGHSSATTMSHDNSYRYVHRLLLTMYHTEQIRKELANHSTRYFPRVEFLTLQFEKTVSNYLFGLYIEKLINVNYVQQLTLNGKCYTVGTLYELIQRLPNLNRLIITSNQRIVIKQLFQRRHEHVLSLLDQRLRHLNLFYDGVYSYELVQSIRFHFTRLNSFAVCLPHFEDFRDTVPGFMAHFPSLHYLHIGLEGDYDKKHFGTQDMFDWFRRHTNLTDFHFHVDAYTNSIHIWF